MQTKTFTLGTSVWKERATSNFKRALFFVLWTPNEGGFYVCRN